MEKIKNMLHPGKSKDDEVMYGSGQSDDPVHAGTGPQATSAYNDNDRIANDNLNSPSGPAANSARDPVGQGGMGSIQQGSNPSSGIPGTFDAEDVGSTSSIKSGLAGTNQESKVIGVSEDHDPLDTSKALPREPAVGGAQGYGPSTTTGAGPHSSVMANTADPRVDSDLDASRGLGGQGTTGTSGGLTGSSLPDRTTEKTTNTGAHDSTPTNLSDSRRDSDRDVSTGLGATSGYGTGTGATAGSAHQGDFNRHGVEPTTTGASVTSSNPVGYSEKTWTHDHNNLGHDFAGDPCADQPPAPGAPHFTPGPHSLDTTNRLDPHVSGGIVDAPISTGDTSTSSTGHHHPGRDIALAAGADSAGAGVYKSSRDAPSTSTSQSEKTTAGPHKSNMMNEMDPRVDSDLSRQQGTSSTSRAAGLESGSTVDPSTSQEHHTGRDATLAPDAGGTAIFEGAKHHHGPEATTGSGYGSRDQGIPQGTSSSGYANPYPPGSTGGGAMPDPSTGSGYESTTGTTSRLHSSNVVNTADPRIVSDGDGRRGLESGTGHTGTTGGYPSSTAGTATSAAPTSTSEGHQYGRDAGIVGAGAAHAADKHLRGPHGDTTEGRNLDTTSTQQPLSSTSDPSYGREPALTGAGTTGHDVSRHQQTATAGTGSQQTAYDERNHPKESNIGREAALGAGAGAAAAAGGQEFSKKEAEKEAERAQKEAMKEQKAMHKEEEKAAKHHQHEVEKAEKKHQHDLEKAEKAHEKKMEKEEAKHHKDEPQHGEKKHHGLLGFLHRDKSGKKSKEDETSREEQEEQEAHPGAGTAETSTGGTLAGTEGSSEMEKHERAKEHDRNRLHKDPPPGYGDPPIKGYATQVTGGSGTTALAQGDPVSSGSHATGLGNKTDTGVTGVGETVNADSTRDNEGRLIEPRTGLPVDTSKGDGAGGTDSTPIHGIHPEQSGTRGATTASGNEGDSFGHFQDHAR
ncbi:MAG: hypothetical protein Q9208_003171 [Pyrenodesmia sp. 3 TL-2023]